jgi:hypothetical protein
MYFLNLILVLSVYFTTTFTTPTPINTYRSLVPRDSGSSIQITTDAQGNYEMAFYENNALQGTIVENTPNDTYPYYFIALDSAGNLLDASSILDQTAQGVQEAEEDFANIFQQAGNFAIDVWIFISCVGPGVVFNCMSSIVSCPNLEIWNCPGLVACLVNAGIQNIEACYPTSSG